MSLVLANRRNEIGRLLDAVEAFGNEHALGPDLVHRLSLALDEVVANVVRHAYDEAGAERIDVRLWLEGGLVVAEVEDRGRPFDPLRAPAPDLDAKVEDRPVGGLGLHLLRAVMDRLSYERRGNRNILRMEARR
jgi:anti-sigma regulatory factor (Ser/Thr protein kinase)